jgi:hypothetical protein
MDKELQLRITYFFDCWRQRYEFVSQLDLTKRRYEANVLLWGSLDALSNLWAKNIGKKNCGNSGKRIIFDAFLARYGGDIFKLVSLPDVWSRVDRGETWIDEKKGIKLPENVSIFLSTIERHKICPTIYKYEDDLGMDARTTRSTSNDLSIDYIINQTLSNCPEMNRSELEKWLILSRYGASAYKEFRNAYIHEGRPGKKTHDFKLDGWTERPTYQSWVYSTPPIMGFSVEFMLGVFKRCIENFETEALTLQVDPAPN